MKYNFNLVKLFNCNDLRNVWFCIIGHNNYIIIVLDLLFKIYVLCTFLWGLLQNFYVIFTVQLLLIFYLLK